MAITPILLNQSSLEISESADIDLDNDFLALGSAANAGKIAKMAPQVLFDRFLSEQSGESSQQALVNGQVLDEDDLNDTLTNTGATASVTATLPPAVQGLLVVATKIEDFTFRLDVDGTDYVRGGLAGGYIEIVEGTVVLECLSDGAWEVVGQSHEEGWILQNETTILSGSLDLLGSSRRRGTYTNLGALADIFLKLPSATVGVEITALKEQRGFRFDIDCQDADRFDDFQNGVPLALVDNGYAVFRCLKAGVWSIISRRGLMYNALEASQRTIYLSTTGNDSSDGLSSGSPKLTLRGIQAIARPGDVVSVAAGTYTGSSNAFVIENLPLGTKENRITFTCSTAFGARFPEIDLEYPSYSYIQRYRWYLDFTNFVFIATDENNIQGYDLRFFRCGFIGGSTTPDVNLHTCFVGGGNAYYRGAKNVLLEDCVSFGAGGRDKFVMYNAEDCIVRRCVARWDQGWDSSGTILCADFVMYDSARCEYQNCISIDSEAPSTSPGRYKAAYTMTQNYLNASDISLRGCMVVNNQGPACDANSLETNDVDVPSADSTTDRKMRANNWLVQDFAAAKILHPSAHSTVAFRIGVGPVTVENVTIADLNRAAAAGVGIYAEPEARWVNGSRVINAVIAYGSTGGAAYTNVPASVTSSGHLGYADLATAAAAGLTYFLRPDLSSTIASAHAGANILKRIGATGSLYGEPGFKQVGDGTTASDLWPFPYETDIKALFVEFGGTARGWISTGDTLTEYIWGTLGTAGPP